MIETFDTKGLLLLSLVSSPPPRWTCRSIWISNHVAKSLDLRKLCQPSVFPKVCKLLVFPPRRMHIGQFVGGV